MKKYKYIASWADQTLNLVGEATAVLGDSKVSQVEVILPSNFGIDPTAAIARMYFRIPGDIEKKNETLAAATQDENGDYHVVWTIKHAHTQTAGRVMFTLSLFSGDDVQWNSRTATLPVYESQYKPESEEAEEPYTGRLTTLEGDMAEIRREFADVKSTATLGTPKAVATAAEMINDGKHTYIYTGTESGYTAGHVYYYVNGTLTDGGQYGGVAIDDTLTSPTMAAPASTVGQIKEDLDAIEPGLSAAAKAALLNCFDHVAWEDDSGREYYNSLKSALYENVYPKITAIFNPGAHTVYTDDSLESLKPYLNVKYYEDSASEGTTVSSYTLSGTLEEGTSIITVLYQGLHTGVSINNIVDFYSIHEWSMSNGLLKAHVGTVQTDSTRGMIIAEGAADRRTVGVSHGVVPYYGTVTADWLDIYPIPVPMNAKKCTLTITPSKSLISRGFRIISNGKYGSSISWVTYTQGPIVIDLPEMSEQHYMQIVTQYETGSSSYPEEIEEFTVSYSDEE